MSQALARIKPTQRMAVPHGTPRALNSQQKAAIIVRLMLAEGVPIQISTLPEQMQSALAEQIGAMRLIDRTTLQSVVDEFLEQLEQVGLSFPGGIEAALHMMDGHISTTAATNLRRLAGADSAADPWDRIVTQPIEKLMPVLEEESTEVGAVLLSKLAVPKAAELLGKLPGEKARRIAFAVSMTGNVDPGTVRRIGLSLAAQLDNQPIRAFSTNPVERVGAILNVSPSVTREDVLKGLQEEDAAFADLVRKAIFTFAHLPRRVVPRDVPKIARILDQPVLVTALAAAQSDPVQLAAAEFILANMSQRLAQSLREDMAARGKVKEKDAEDAMNAIVTAIRTLEAGGELVLIVEEDE